MVDRVTLTVVLTLLGGVTFLFWRLWDRQNETIRSQGDEIESIQEDVQALEEDLSQLVNLATGSEMTEQDNGHFGELFEKVDRMSEQVDELHQNTQQVNEQHRKTERKVDEIQSAAARIRTHTEQMGYTMEDLIEELDRVENIDEFDSDDVPEVDNQIPVDD